MFMKGALATAFLAVIVLGWRLLSVSRMMLRQMQEIHELRVALTNQSQEEELSHQTECAAAAQKFLTSRGWKAGEGDTYENHFNSRLNKCFVLVSSYTFKGDFRTFDLFDAVEGRRYASYIGHDLCLMYPKRCLVDSGSIWFDGNDYRSPADFVVGFRGLLHGGGAGDESTQKAFLERVRNFMSQ